MREHTDTDGQQTHGGGHTKGETCVEPSHNSQLWGKHKKKKRSKQTKQNFIPTLTA